MAHPGASCSHCHADLPALPGISPAALEEVAAEIRRGNKIMAIKRVREIAGCGLREAKDYVDCPHAVPTVHPTVHPAPAPAAAPATSVAATAPATTAVCPVCQSALPPVPEDPRAREEVAAALATRNTVEAIRLLRARTRWGLVEARDYVLCPHRT